jgi:hypothetical protein
MKSGVYVTVRINQFLSTDHNRVGDTFAASLVAPVVADGIVVANRGQTVYGHIAQLQKQNSDRPSGMGLELTALTLADGTQTPINSQLVGMHGPSTPGSVQAGTVVGTTAVGAAIGGVAAWGTGAAIGAGAGAAAGIIGVLLTRHHATVVYPETVLTFRITSPVNISTANTTAFRFVGPDDFNQPSATYAQGPPRPRPGPPVYGYGYGPSPYYMPAPAYYYPYYWGPTVWIGSGWGWGGYRGGWYGRRWR